MLHWTPLLPEQPNLSAVGWLLVPCRDQMASPRTDIYHTMSQLKSRDATSRDAQSLVEVSIIPFPSISTNSFFTTTWYVYGRRYGVCLIVVFCPSCPPCSLHRTSFDSWSSSSNSGFCCSSSSLLTKCCSTSAQLHLPLYNCSGPSLTQGNAVELGLIWTKHPRHQPYLLHL